MSVALVQYAFGQHTKLLQLTHKHHYMMCSSLEIQYLVHVYKPTGHPYWEKPRLIAEALESYDVVIWLDADTLWVDGDIREANTTHMFGMTWHDRETPHYNAGAIYLNNSLDCRNMVSAWLMTPDDGHVWADQYSLNKLLNMFPDTVLQLDHSWNCMDIYPHESPNVLAWHGSNGHCLGMMEAEMVRRGLV